MLRQLVKYLEEQSQRHQGHQQHPKWSEFHQAVADKVRSKHQLDLDWDLLAALANKENLADFHRKKLKEWNYQRTRYNEPIDELPREREHYLPSYELNPYHNPLEYPSFKLPYPREDAGPRDEGYDYDLGVPFKHPFQGTRSLDKGMKEEPTLEFQESYDGSENGDDGKLVKPHVAAPEFAPDFGTEFTPQFTFRFADSNLKDRHPFAVKPNDPRYYQDAPFFEGMLLSFPPLRF